MQRKYKKFGIIIGIVLLVLVIANIITDIVIEQKIGSYIENLPNNINVKYDAIDASIVSGDVSLNSPKITVKGKTTGETILKGELNTLKINGFSYWDYLFNSQVSINDLIIDKPVLKYTHNPKAKGKSASDDFLGKIKQIISLETISVSDADILVVNKETDSLVFSAPQLNFTMTDVSLNKKEGKNKPPFSYKGFNLNSGKIEYAISDFENIKIDSVVINDNSTLINSFKLKTKYSKQKLSQIINKERDYFDVYINEIQIENPKLQFDANMKSNFKAKKMTLSSPEIDVYRDKLVADDLTPKPLYGKMLRELGFKMGINEIEIKDGRLTYSEKVKADSQAGTLDFKEFNVAIKNLGNIYGNKDTTIKVNTAFMETAPLEVNWNFKVQDTLDRFVFKADLGFFEAEQIDQFTQPNLNVDMNGELIQTYFTISGNPQSSNIDLKVKYDDFEVVILKKNGREENRLLSGLINLFVSKDSKSEKNNFRYGESENVERDNTKSVFNFVWLNVQGGLLSAMAGDGEKED